MNDSGQVVGYSRMVTNSDAPSHAFLYSDGVMNDLGTLGGSSSVANDINESGQVVGSSLTSTPGVGEHAFLYIDGVMYDLGTFGDDTSSQAVAVNNSGQIIGISYTSNVVPPHAVLWNPVVVPEPISSTLFLIGAGVLAGRRYLRKKK